MPPKNKKKLTENIFENREIEGFIEILINEHLIKILRQVSWLFLIIFRERKVFALLFFIIRSRFITVVTVFHGLHLPSISFSLSNDVKILISKCCRREMSRVCFLRQYCCHQQPPKIGTPANHSKPLADRTLTPRGRRFPELHIAGKNDNSVDVHGTYHVRR